MKQVEVFKQMIWNFNCPECSKWNYLEYRIHQHETVTCECGTKFKVEEVSEI